MNNWFYVCAKLKWTRERHFMCSVKCTYLRIAEMMISQNVFLRVVCILLIEQCEKGHEKHHESFHSQRWCKAFFFPYHPNLFLHRWKIKWKIKTQYLSGIECLFYFYYYFNVISSALYKMPFHRSFIRSQYIWCFPTLNRIDAYKWLFQLILTLIRCWFSQIPINCFYFSSILNS